MTDTTGNNVISFPRIGFSLTPTVPGPPAITPPNTPTPDDVTRPDWDAVTVPSGVRRSPLDILGALPDPGITQPVIPAQPAPAAGHVPAAFRNEPADDMVGPRLGALSLAAILAVAVAALRGSHGLLTDWRQRRMARQAETDPLRQARLKHQLAMQGISDKAAQQRAKTNRVPSSSQFGRKTLGGRGGSGSGGGSGTGGSGRGGAGKKGPSSSGAGSPKKPSNGGSRSGGGGGSKQNNRPDTKKRPKSPHSPNRSGGNSLRQNRRKNRPDTGGSNGRTTLSDALKNDTSKAADRRLKRRRKHGLDKPALWKADDRNNRSKKNRRKNADGTGADTSSNGRQKVDLTKRKNPNPKDQVMWNDLKKAAARRWKRRRNQWEDGKVPPVWKTSRKQKPGRDEKTQTRGPGKSRWQRIRDRARAKAPRGGRPGSTGPRTNPGAGTAGGAAGGATGGRRSPFENAGHAAANATPTYTVERDDYVGAQARRWEPDALTQGQPSLPATGPAALDAAPNTYPPRPGTTRPPAPRPMPPVPARPDPRITKAKHQAARTAQHTVARRMDDQHATEITLDDACDAADQLAGDAFKAHDESRRIARKARDLRDTWLQFADDLATNHNLIGPLFTAAAISFAESMDLVARMADEMETTSLNAAEKAETAGNELNDAYRPYTTATADAGLATPSAPIHNRA